MKTTLALTAQQEAFMNDERQRTFINSVTFLCIGDLRNTRPRCDCISCGKKFVFAAARLTTPVFGGGLKSSTCRACWLKAKADLQFAEALHQSAAVKARDFVFIRLATCFSLKLETVIAAGMTALNEPNPSDHLEHALALSPGSIARVMRETFNV